jgi:hypothetical protein
VANYTIERKHDGKKRLCEACGPRCTVDDACVLMRFASGASCWMCQRCFVDELMGQRAKARIASREPYEDPDFGDGWIVAYGMVCFEACDDDTVVFFCTGDYSELEGCEVVND